MQNKHQKTSQRHQRRTRKRAEARLANSTPQQQAVAAIFHFFGKDKSSNQVQVRPETSTQRLETARDVLERREREHLKGGETLRKQAEACLDEHGTLQLNLLRHAIQEQGTRVLSFLPVNQLQDLMKFCKEIPPDLQLVLNENILANEEFARTAVLYNGSSSIPSFVVPVYQTASARAWGAGPHSSFKARCLSAEELLHPHITANEDVTWFGAATAGECSIVPSLSQFKFNLDAFTQGLLRGMDLTTVVVAGGTVAACLLPLPTKLQQEHHTRDKYLRELDNELPFDVKELRELVMGYAGMDRALWEQLAAHYSSDDHPFGSSDIDLFLIVENEEEAKVKAQQCLEIAKRNLPEGVTPHLLRTRNSFTLVSRHPYRHVQLVVMMHKSIEEAMLFADLDCTAFVYTAGPHASWYDTNGQVFAHPRAIRAVNTRTNFVHPRVLQRDSAAARVQKYYRRGFGAILFGFCNHEPRCDVEVDFKVLSKFCQLQSTSSRSRRDGYVATSDIPYGRSVGFNPWRRGAFALTKFEDMFSWEREELEGAPHPRVELKPFCWRREDVLVEEAELYPDPANEGYHVRFPEEWRLMGVASGYWEVLMQIEQEWGQVKGLYVHGSSVYSNKQPEDVDLLAIIDHPKRGFAPSTPEGQFKLGKFEVSLFPRSFWLASLEAMDLTMLATLSYAKEFVIVPFSDPSLAQFSVKRPILRKEVLRYAEFTWAKALRLMDSDLPKAAKNVYFVFRILNMGTQLAKWGIIANFRDANHWYDQVLEFFQEKNIQLGQTHHVIAHWKEKIDFETAQFVASVK